MNSSISGGANTRIGTNADGTSDVAERNVVSGNTSNDIFLNTSSGTVIAGNYVGTTPAGTAGGMAAAFAARAFRRERPSS